MSRKVWKIEVSVHDAAGGGKTVRLPGFEAVLHVDAQHADRPDLVALWVLVDDERPEMTARVVVTPTGGEVPPGYGHIGTVVTGNGALVWHVWSMVLA